MASMAIHPLPPLKIYPSSKIRSRRLLDTSTKPLPAPSKPSRRRRIFLGSLILQRRHADIVPLNLALPGLLPAPERDADPGEPDDGGDDDVGDLGACPLAAEAQAEEPLHQAEGEDHAAVPDVRSGVDGGALVVFVLDVVDVAEDGLGDEEEDDGNAGDGVEFGELGMGLLAL